MNTLFESVVENTGLQENGKPVTPVVCAVLMPHAPVLVPPVGGSRVGAVAASVRALREAARRVMSLQPETMVVISPHSPRKSGAFGVWSDDSVAGSFEEFGALHGALQN